MTAPSGGGRPGDGARSPMSPVLERPEAAQGGVRPEPRPLGEIFPQGGNANRGRELQGTWRAFCQDMAGAVQAARARGITVSLQNESSGLNMPTEINVIGRTVDEATREVEKFVDRAFLAGMPRVRIVHGHGMGILKKMVAEMLAKHPHVARFYPAPQQEGGSGATIAELRE